MKCLQCNAELDAMDIGAYRKMIDKTAKEFLCRDCLAKHLNWERSFLDAKIQQMREWGCTLFPPLEKEKKTK